MHLGLHYYRNLSVDRPGFARPTHVTVSAVTSWSCPDASRRKQPSTENVITQTDRIASAPRSGAESAAGGDAGAANPGSMNTRARLSRAILSWTSWASRLPDPYQPRPVPSSFVREAQLASTCGAAILVDARAFLRTVPDAGWP